MRRDGIVDVAPVVPRLERRPETRGILIASRTMLKTPARHRRDRVDHRRHLSSAEADGTAQGIEPERSVVPPYCVVFGRPA